MNESGAEMLLSEAELEKICVLFEAAAGRQARAYSPEQISRAVMQRQRLTRQPSFEAYLASLEPASEEVQRLASALFSGSTGFFYDSQTFALLAEHVLPELLTQPGPDLRIWVTACASGEEAYSLAMLLDSLTKDFVQSGQVSRGWQIFASDTDRRAIQQAASGCYHEAVLPLQFQTAQFKAEHWATYFERQGDQIQVIQELREQVIFAVHDLFQDPSLGHMDLLCCRNLLKDLRQDYRQRLYQLFSFALSPDAYLVLGSDEPLPEATGFESYEPNLPLYRRLPDADLLKLNRMVYQAKPQTISAEAPEKQIQADSYHPDSTRALQAIFNSSHESMMLLDAQLMIQAFNPGFVRWTENAELLNPQIGMSILDILPAGMRDSFYQQMRLILADGRTIEVERVFKNSQDETFWYVVTRSPVYDAEGLITGICVTARDISERKRVEAQLSEYADRLTLILEGITDAFVTLDSEGRFTYANQAAVRLLKMDENKLVGHSLWALFPASEAPLFADRYRWALIYQEPVHFEVHNKRLSAWLEVSVYPSEDSFSVFLRDVTEIKLSRSVIEMEREILSRYAVGRESSDVLLDLMLRQVQDLLPGAHCLVQVPRADGQALELLRAPDLKPEQLAVLAEVSLQAGQGSAAEAAHLGKPVIIQEIAQAECWQERAQKVRAQGFQACWSYPVLSPEQELLAVFSCFFVNPRRPQRAETMLAERVSQLLAMMLENQRRDEAMRQLNLRYELAARATNDVIWDWDLSQAQVSWSESLRSRFGHTELLTDADWRFKQIHPDDQASVKQGLLAHLEARLPHWQAEYRFAHADGSYSHILDRAYLVLDDHNQGLRMLGAMQDITERKQAEDQLRKSELHLLTSQKIAHVGSWEVDLLAGVSLEEAPVYWSEECYRIFGYEPHTVIPSVPLVFSRIHPDDLADVQAAILHTLTTGELYSIEHRAILPDGRERQLWQRAELARDPVTGLTARVIGTVQDISERKQAEAALRMSKQRHEFAAQAANQAIWDWNLANNQIDWNSALEALFGYSSEQISSDLAWWQANIHPDDRERVYQSLQQHIQEGRPHWQASYRFCAADGNYLQVLDQAYLLLTEKGEPVRMIGTLHLDAQD